MKIKKDKLILCDLDGKRALIFYSGLLMVLNDVIEKYGDRDENKKR